MINEQVLAHALLENHRRHALAFQQFFITCIGELAVFAEGLDIANNILDLAVGDDQPGAYRAIRQQALLHQIINHRETQLSAVQHAGVNTAARHPLQHFLPLAQGHREFALGDLVIADSRHDVSAGPLLKIRINAEKGKRRNDQHENSDHDRSAVLVDQIEHQTLSTANDR